MRLKLLIAALTFTAALPSRAEQVDASDPTKFYNYGGPGYKYTRFDDGASGCNDWKLFANASWSF